MLTYKAVAFDYDDTLVASSPQIHYPSWVQILKELRPHIYHTYEEFESYCFDPGFFKLLTDIMHFTPEEIAYQNKRWHDFADNTIPDFFPGILTILHRLNDKHIPWFIVSHSEQKQITKTFKAKTDIMPKFIYGSDLRGDKVKPHPFPLLDASEKLDIAPSDIIMIDDLLPGKKMAASVGAQFIAAGWGQDVPKIREAMLKECAHYAFNVNELASLLFEK